MSFAQHARAQSFHLGKFIFQHKIPKPGHGPFLFVLLFNQEMGDSVDQIPFLTEVLRRESFVTCLLLTTPSPAAYKPEAEYLLYYSVRAHTRTHTRMHTHEGTA